jgi:hypothetical protein
LLGSTATFWLSTQGVNGLQKLAFFVELKELAAHDAHFRSLELVGGTLT